MTKERDIAFIQILKFITKEWWGKIFFVICISIIVSLLEILFLSLMTPVLSMMNNGQIGNLPFDLALDNDSFFILILVIIVILGLLRLFLAKYQPLLAQKIGSWLSCIIYKNITSINLNDFNLLNASEIQSAISMKLAVFVNRVVIQLIVALNSLLIISIVTMYLIINVGYISILALFIIAGSYLIILRMLSNRLRVTSEITSRNQDDMLKILETTFGSFREMKVNHNEDYYLSKYTLSDTIFRNTQGKLQFYTSAPKFILESISLLFFISCLWFATVYNPPLIPLIILLLIGFIRLLPLIQQVYACIVNVKGSLDVSTDLYNLINLSNTNANENIKSNLLLTHGFERIQVDNLCYTHPGTSEALFNNVNFVINSGDIVGITGPSGSGKSTLVDIILGLRNPSSGSVNVYHNKSLHINNQFANIVPQKIFISYDTIINNIVMDDKNVDYKRLYDLLDSLNIRESIECLADGYNTLINDHGSKLSGGQRQRLGIARGLYKEPCLLVLDESTNGLDEYSESCVFTALRNYCRSGGTVLLVSHRLSSLSFCDKVVRL